jgi:hypothetical protein
VGNPSAMESLDASCRPITDLVMVGIDRHDGPKIA